MSIIANGKTRAALPTDRPWWDEPVVKRVDEHEARLMAPSWRPPPVFLAIFPVKAGEPVAAVPCLSLTSTVVVPVGTEWNCGRCIHCDERERRARRKATRERYARWVDTQTGAR